VIEHPKWIPEAAQKKLDLRAGEDKGRIYRIYPEDKQPRPIARLDKLNTAGLVVALDSPNGPQRDLVQQMLIWRNDKACLQPLERFVTQNSRPQTRLQALCTLDGLGAASDELLVAAMEDKHPGVRRHAVRLAESRLKNSSNLINAFTKILDDPDPQVQMQVAYSLGEWTDPHAAAALAKRLATNSSDTYLSAAALSSINKANVTDVLSIDFGSSTTGDKLLAMATAMGADDAVRQALTVALRQYANGTYAEWQFKSLAAANDALVRRKVKLSSLLDNRGEEQLARLLAFARQAVVSPPTIATVNRSMAAMQVLARGLDDQDDADVLLLGSQLAPQKEPQLREAAVSALAHTGRRDVPDRLLAAWQSHSPAMRSQIIEALAGREDWSLALLSAVENGQIAASQFDARRRQQFTSSRNRNVRERAEKVLAAGVDTNRQKLVETYLPVAASGNGDASRGKAVFAKRCANCHKLEGAGYAVGPDLAPFATRSPDYLLTQILDPNRALEDRYLEYLVLTTDGRQLTGMLVEETGASLTLTAPEGKQTVIPRSDIDQIKSSGKSLMPEGIEKDVSPAEMADLVAYLRTTAAPPKSLPGNQPEIVQRYVLDNSIRLLATAARIYGPTLTFEEKYRNLGYWSSPEDQAAWTFEIPAGGEGDYRVMMDYSCADDAAGNTAIVEVAGQKLAAKVAGTGSWDEYRGLALGTVKLAAGQGELLVHSEGPIKNALLDLRAVRLVPISK
jgi:putative heme-binding domain-containing protein